MPPQFYQFFFCIFQIYIGNLILVSYQSQMLQPVLNPVMKNICCHVISQLLDSGAAFPIATFVFAYSNIDRSLLLSPNTMVSSCAISKILHTAAMPTALEKAFRDHLNGIPGKTFPYMANKLIIVLKLRTGLLRITSRHDLRTDLINMKVVFIPP